ncbi:MAG TPA: 23S rRNA pseudouridine(2604) synthase RluF [Flavipsychrobacter sp.]|nr:23S rRNA pseudouridine(2604) synthase RluF [Flavipsychrobacter sp.]
MPRKVPKQIHEDSISLNKYISDTGFCSRREADDYIEQQRVTINKNIAAAGNRVFDGDMVEIDGEPIKKKVKTVYIAFHKPRGITSTTDQKDKTNIVDCINFKQRIFPIGRLDKESEGLIFLTNDGNIVNKILRAGNQHEKEYLVTVDKIITPEFVKNMSEGVRILRTKTKSCKVVQENKYVFRIVLTQGMNRQIRRMCDALDYKVKKLVRIRIMNVRLGKLPLGHWRFLTEEEITLINKMVADSSKTQVVSSKPRILKPSPPPSGEGEEQNNLDHYLQAYEAEKAKPKKQGFKDFRKGGKKK